MRKNFHKRKTRLNLLTGKKHTQEESKPLVQHGYVPEQEEQPKKKRDDDDDDGTSFLGAALATAAGEILGDIISDSFSSDSSSSDSSSNDSSFGGFDGGDFGGGGAGGGW